MGVGQRELQASGEPQLKCSIRKVVLRLWKLEVSLHPLVCLSEEVEIIPGSYSVNHLFRYLPGYLPCLPYIVLRITCPYMPHLWAAMSSIVAKIATTENYCCWARMPCLYDNFCLDHRRDQMLKMRVTMSQNTPTHILVRCTPS